jgi:hypothetical protein
MFVCTLLATANSLLQYLIEHTGSQLIVTGTGTLKPVSVDHSPIDGATPYWQMERFTFTSAGRLLSRESEPAASPP